MLPYHKCAALRVSQTYLFRHAIIQLLVVSSDFGMTRCDNNLWIYSQLQHFSLK
ncbi:hypothetical protein GGR19_000623 [Croceicoccus naphthovorans]|nr:hypothetical protein [Croceicoccus naphthovorans]